MTNAAIADLVGKTLSAIEVNNDQDEITFETSEGQKFQMYHSQDCCESVSIEDINGDLNILIGSPILVAEEATSEDDPPGYPERDYAAESQTWTFYKLATINGHVDIRWYGSSNGYYSEAVEFGQVSN